MQFLHRCCYCCRIDTLALVGVALVVGIVGVSVFIVRETVFDVDLVPAIIVIVVFVVDLADFSR